MLKIGTKVCFEEDGVICSGVIGAYDLIGMAVVVLDLDEKYPNFSWRLGDSEWCNSVNKNLGYKCDDRLCYYMSQKRIKEIKGDDTMAKREIIVIGNKDINGDIYHDIKLGSIIDNYTINGGVITVKHPDRLVGQFLGNGDVLYLDECKYCHFNDLRDLMALGYRFEEDGLYDQEGIQALPNDLLYLIDKTYKIDDIKDDVVVIKTKGIKFNIFKRYVGTLIELRK